MFTGIIREIGTVGGITRQPPGAALDIRCDAAIGGAALGDSISVNGVCLTVTGLPGGGFRTECMGETLARTTLGGLRLGDRVNLEPALRAGDRLDGHLVLGHVDGVGNVAAASEQDGWMLLRCAVPPELARFLAVKGSVCVDGVSLTVVSAGPAEFSVGLIPHTLASTTLGQRRPGDPVNLEVDVIARYVDRLLGAPPASPPGTLDPSDAPPEP